MRAGQRSARLLGPILRRQQLLVVMVHLRIGCVVSEVLGGDCDLARRVTLEDKPRALGSVRQLLAKTERLVDNRYVLDQLLRLDAD